MKILYLAFTDKDIDSRTRDLIAVANKIGDVFYVGMSNSHYVDNNSYIVRYCNNKPWSFIKFIIVSLNCALAKDYQYIFIDNYHAAFCGLIIRFFKHSTPLIMDSRELYLPEDLPSIFGKILVRCEKYLMRRADVIICANEIRSKICKGLFHLSQLPIVFENIHWFKNCATLSHQKDHDVINVVITDGLNPDRLTNECISAINKLDERFHFYIIGACAENEVNHVKSLIEPAKIRQIHFMGKMDYVSLGEFLKKCDIGIVKYSFNNLNNIFCASGKIYEFLMSGIPVVTTEHIVFKEICYRYGVGIADNSFFKGIREIANNIDSYNMRVKNYQQKIKEVDYIGNCSKAIKEVLDEL